MKSSYDYLGADVLYEGKKIDLLKVPGVNRNGDPVVREIVDHPGAVVILPLLDDKNVILIRNDRPAVQQVLWELPAGTLELNEEPEGCAARELEEETGYSPKKIVPLLECFSTPGFCNEILYAYIAEDLTFVGQKLDDSEEISVEIVPLSRAFEMIREGIIRDAKTLCALLYFSCFHSKAQ